MLRALAAILAEVLGTVRFLADCRQNDLPGSGGFRAAAPRSTAMLSDAAP
jgi:hypothetical protein